MPLPPGPTRAIVAFPAGSGGQTGIRCWSARRTACARLGAGGGFDQWEHVRGGRLDRFAHELLLDPESQEGALDGVAHGPARDGEGHRDGGGGSVWSSQRKLALRLGGRLLVGRSLDVQVLHDDRLGGLGVGQCCGERVGGARR